jgi:hypothetical protein
MDPNLFHIDWERTIEALVGIIVVAFLVERACALLFESRWWISKFEDSRVANVPGKKKDEKPPELLPAHRYPLKEIIAFIVALVVCYFWDFDAVSIILLSDHTSLAGVIITSLVVAGGSKASIGLFHDILKVRSNAEEQRKTLREQDKQGEGKI